MEEKFRFFAYDVIEDGDGMFQVNNRMLQKGYIILNVDYDGIVLDDDYDIIGAVHDNWVESDTELGNFIPLFCGFCKPFHGLTKISI